MQWVIFLLLRMIQKPFVSFYLLLLCITMAHGPRYICMFTGSLLLLLSVIYGKFKTVFTDIKYKEDYRL